MIISFYSRQQKLRDFNCDLKIWHWKQNMKRKEKITEPFFNLLHVIFTINGFYLQQKLAGEITSSPSWPITVATFEQLRLTAGSRPHLQVRPKGTTKKQLTDSFKIPIEVYLCPVSQWEGVGPLVDGDSWGRTAHPQTVPSFRRDTPHSRVDDNSVPGSCQSPLQSRAKPLPKELPVKHQHVHRAEPWNSRNVEEHKKRFTLGVRRLLFQGKRFCRSRQHCPPFRKLCRWTVFASAFPLSKLHLPLLGSFH